MPLGDDNGDARVAIFLYRRHLARVNDRQWHIALELFTRDRLLLANSLAFSVIFRSLSLLYDAPDAGAFVRWRAAEIVILLHGRCGENEPGAGILTKI